MWKRGYFVQSEADLNFELLKAIKQLSENYQIFAFTDCLDIDNEDTLVQQQVYPCFQQVIFSTVEGLEKSNLEAYHNLLTKLRIKPVESLLIDDKETNIQLANQVGIKRVLFDSNSSYAPLK